MTQASPDLKEQFRAQATTALTEHRETMQTILHDGILHAQRTAEQHMRTFTDDSRRLFATAANRLLPHYRLALWPIAFLAGALGGAVAALFLLALS